MSSVAVSTTPTCGCLNHVLPRVFSSVNWSENLFIGIISVILCLATVPWCKEFETFTAGSAKACHLQKMCGLPILVKVNTGKIYDWVLIHLHLSHLLKINITKPCVGLLVVSVLSLDPFLKFLVKCEVIYVPTAQKRSLITLPFVFLTTLINSLKVCRPVLDSVVVACFLQWILRATLLNLILPHTLYLCPMKCYD